MNPKIVYLALFTLLVLSLCRSVTRSILSDSSATADKYEEVTLKLERATREMKIPGMSVSLFHDGKVWSKSYGFSMFPNKRATPETPFLLASVSKAISAVATLQLVEAKTIGLDADVRKYCPEFPIKKWPIKVRHLLAHSAGIRHYQNEDEVKNTKKYQSSTEALSIFKNDNLLFEPGTSFEYSTYGYTLLGCVIEGATKEKFADFLKRQIFDRAGMKNSGIYGESTQDGHCAQGYVSRWQKAFKRETSATVPGGGIYSSSEDLMKFAKGIFSNALISGASKKIMFSVPSSSPKDEPYALGWYVWGKAGNQHVMHRGGTFGASTVLFLIPEKAFAIAILVNAQGNDLSKIAFDIGEILVGDVERF